MSCPQGLGASDPDMPGNRVRLETKYVPEPDVFRNWDAPENQLRGAVQKLHTVVYRLRKFKC